MIKESALNDIPNYAALLKVQEASPATYLTLLSMVQERAEERLRKQAKIRLAFVISNISTWIGDDLCLRLMQEKRFEVSVVFVWQKNMDYDHELALAKAHFDKTDIRFVIAGEGDHAGQYDVLFYLVPYLDMLDGHFDLRDVPLSSLICYTGYALFQSKLEQWQFNLPIHNCCWKNFAHARRYLEMAEEFCGIGSKRMVFSGHPKLDPICKKQDNDLTEKYWKFAGNSNVLKIIYAPHHSLEAQPYLSTFAQNYEFFYQYAKNHPNTTSWIIKPHPLLRVASVKAGVFPDADAYEAWLRKWDELPNACSMDGEYVEMFPTSDCMILDCSSFKAEYLYTRKPALFLTRSAEQFNALGQEVAEVLYKVSGEDTEGICAFIENGVKADMLRGARNKFFERELDYYGYNHMTATNLIAETLTRELRDSTWRRFFGCLRRRRS